MPNLEPRSPTARWKGDLTFQRQTEWDLGWRLADALHRKLKSQKKQHQRQPTGSIIVQGIPYETHLPSLLSNSTSITIKTVCEDIVCFRNNRESDETTSERVQKMTSQTKLRVSTSFFFLGRAFSVIAPSWLSLHVKEYFNMIRFTLYVSLCWWFCWRENNLDSSLR